jgi:hypothetical protein
MLAGALAAASGSALAADAANRVGDPQGHESWLWSTGDFYPGSAEQEARKPRELGQEPAQERQPATPAEPDAVPNDGAPAG